MSFPETGLHLNFPWNQRNPWEMGPLHMNGGKCAHESKSNNQTESCRMDFWDMIPSSSSTELKLKWITDQLINQQTNQSIKSINQPTNQLIKQASKQATILPINPSINQSITQKWNHLHDLSEVFSLNVVVCLDEDLSQPTLADRVVLGIELVKPVECVAVLHSGREREREFWLINWLL